ncbi:hypothetical protein [Paenibacillus allorhizoplanae]|uniref:hypothetical protein n=1 Tax=Paenibacillus allorhizoplanae TaxID=2905648 RepID=UPI001F3DBFA0|nr:hypothetical protein [Paenibacillus allorhizoplanae]
MTEEETRFLLYKASAAYPNQLEIEEETLVVWIERLRPIPFEQALENLDHHIDTNDYFPKIANIIRRDRDFVGEHEQLKLETAERFALLDAWAADVKPPPEGFWNNVRSKLVGEET